MAITQDNRILRLETPLGPDVLLINALRAEEKLSGLFVADVELLHEESEPDGPPHEIQMEQILGKNVTITIHQPDDTERFINGIVRRFVLFNRDEAFTHYRMEVVPQLWLLTRNRQSRIFQEKSVPQILKEVLEQSGIEFKIECQGTFHPRNYCVQYRESDFDFISRLMEEEGIYYFFEHETKSHKMIVANTPSSHRDCPSKSTIEFLEDTSESGEGVFVSSILEWTEDYQLQSGKVTFWDHHFQIPTSKFEASRPTAESDRVSLSGELEVYDYPGYYAKRFDGVDKSGGDRSSDTQKIYEDNLRKANIASQQLGAQFKTIHGMSDCASLTGGHRLEMKNHPLPAANGQYVITSIQHSCTQSPDYTSESSAEAPYSNTFTCIPYRVPFRPPLDTPWPIVQGSQTATVVGPSGEEIFTDKYGRIKVQFHWDREGKPQDGDTSCWVRVAHDLAGKKWGQMHIPRVGQEVIVDFIEGDPDQPIVVGSVYNFDAMPHYELPKFKTLTYLKTRTSPDDGKGFNEIRFEDKANKEQVFIRSQKRYDLRVRGSMYETCGGSRHELIGLKQENQPGGNLAVTVAGCYDLHVKESHFVGIDAKLNETVKSDCVENYQGKQYTEVTGKRELNAQEITLEALNKITLKVGGTFISIDLSGVTISGPMVKINSGGAGMGTGPSDISDPLDAEISDNGEPGYLDKPRKGGGGGGRKSRTLKGQHAPPFQTKTLPNGDIQVGNGLVIKKSPTDPDFQKKALEDLTTMSNYPAGMDTLNSINNSGHTTSIQHKPAGGNNYTPSDTAGALPKGDKFGGTTGTGTGSDGTVGWNPDNAATNAKRPRDVGLHHELSHADHASNGDYDITHNDPSQPNNPHKEESNTIDRDNEYRKQRGVHTRKDHTEL